MGQKNKGKTLVNDHGLCPPLGRLSGDHVLRAVATGSTKDGAVALLAHHTPAILQHPPSPEVPSPWHIPEQVLGTLQELPPEPGQVGSVSQGRDGAWETKSGSGRQREEGAVATTPAGNLPDAGYPSSRSGSSLAHPRDWAGAEAELELAAHRE